MKVGKLSEKLGGLSGKEGDFERKSTTFLIQKGNTRKIQTFSSRTTRLSERKTLSLRLTKHNFPLSCRKATSI